MCAGQSLQQVCLLAGKSLAGLAIRCQALPQAFDGIGLGKQILGDDQIGDLTIKPGDGFRGAFPRGSSCIAANLGLQTSLLERLREQCDVAKLGEFTARRSAVVSGGVRLLLAARAGVSRLASLSALSSTVGKPRGGLFPGSVVLEPLAAVQRALALRFVGFLQLGKPGVDPGLGTSGPEQISSSSRSSSRRTSTRFLRPPPAWKSTAPSSPLP